MMHGQKNIKLYSYTLCGTKLWSILRG